MQYSAPVNADPVGGPLEGVAITHYAYGLPARRLRCGIGDHERNEHQGRRRMQEQRRN
jgi:hypothetical protein